MTFDAVNMGRTGHLSFFLTLEASSMLHSEGDTPRVKTQRKGPVPSMVVLASPAKVQGEERKGLSFRTGG